MNPVYYLPQVGSTNTWAKENIEMFPAVGAVYTTDQTAGRGRLGRAWVDAAGRALYYTVVLDLPPAGLNALATLPLFASLAVCDVLAAHYGVRAQIKWPNDVLLGGKKLVGILCEGVQNRVICGIGINLAQAPAFFEEAALPHATSLAAQGVAVNTTADPAALAYALTDTFAKALPTLYAQGFAPYLDEYRARCVNLGRTVRWEGGTGTAFDVDVDGRLLVRQNPGGEVRLFTGEVSVRGIYGTL